nr:MAG TPA: hypothetical protein [Bacteriophage sp.]
MQNWKKLFNRINWINRPSTATPIDQNNLNKSDSALDGIDDRVITLDTIKADISEVNEMVLSVTLNESTGVLTINYKNGSSQTYNTNLQKIAVNFSYDSVNQRLVITLEDGTYQYVDMSALVTQYEFKESSTITFSVAEDGSISASVKNGSITESMLETGYLANIKVETGKVKNYADNAKSSETQSEYYSKMSMSYANGLSGLRDGEAVDNAKYYMEQAKSAAGMSIATTTTPGKVMATNDVKVSSTGAMSVGTDFEVPEALSSLVSGSEWSEFKGKIAKMIDDYIYEKVNGYSTAGDLVAKSGTSSPVSLSGLKEDIGSTDISTLGDGTITGAISTLNSNYSKLGEVSQTNLGGTVPVPLASFTAVCIAYNIQPGMYLLIGLISDQKDIQYARLSKGDNADDILVNRPYGSRTLVTVATFTTVTTVSLWVYQNAESPMNFVQNEASIIAIRIK